MKYQHNLFSTALQNLVGVLEAALDGRVAEVSPHEAAAVCIRLGVSRLLRMGYSAEAVELRMRACLTSEKKALQRRAEKAN